VLRRFCRTQDKGRVFLQSGFGGGSAGGMEMETAVEKVVSDHILMYLSGGYVLLFAVLICLL